MPTHSDNPNLDAAPNHDPEVSGRVTRRRFTAAQKARILEEYERGSGVERAALCRRERIYSSLISNWRKQHANGGPLAEKRGRKPDPQAAEIARLRKKEADLEQRLAKAEQVIDVQGKVYALLRSVAGKSADQLDLPPWSKR